MPGTFTSISKNLDDEGNSSETESVVIDQIKHVQLIVVGGVCTGIGALGMVWLWYRWHKNYVWLLVGLSPIPDIPVLFTY